jgi:hypothetical protein
MYVCNLNTLHVREDAKHGSLNTDLSPIRVPSPVGEQLQANLMLVYCKGGFIVVSINPVTIPSAERAFSVYIWYHDAGLRGVG